MLLPGIRLFNYLGWLIYLKTSREIKIVIGAGGTKFKGWFSTDIHTLDVTKRSDFAKFFRQKKINKILAEHVLEHLDNAQLELMAKNFYDYSSDDINIRIAVPDGFHADPVYINIVKPGGTGSGADDHKQLFNYISLSDLFVKHGFSSHLVEYWDESGKFHRGYVNDENGFVSRSFINDDRNSQGNPAYTSLIIDFKKK